MKINRWNWYYLFSVLLILTIAILVYIKAYLNLDLGNCYWIIIGVVVYILWNRSLPYKNYIFKMENVYQLKNPLVVLGDTWFYYEVKLQTIDQKMGLCLSFVKINMDGTFCHKRKPIGSIWILPSEQEYILHKISGKLEIVYVKDDQLFKTSYLEEIPISSTGIVVHFAGADSNGIFATLATIKKQPTIFDIIFRKY